MQVTFFIPDKMKGLSNRSRRKPGIIIRPYRPSLPENFAQKLLELEEALDSHYTLPTLQSLTRLYSRGVEYHEAWDEPQYIHYQEKLHELLARRETLSLLTGTINDKLPLSQRIIEVKERQKHRSNALSWQLSHSMLNTRKIEKTIQHHSTQSGVNMRNLRKNIESQCRLLGNRLEVRKKKNRWVSETDIPAGIPIRGDFEEEMEKVIEKFMNEKKRVKREIENKYKEQLDDIKRMGEGEAALSALHEVEKRKKEEIEKEIGELECVKEKEAIAIRKSIPFEFA